ncbi:hypothetical protein [Roseovarius aestuariivivens]|uniref:hypothetical protein n=1 Tax=Roseovarius aestuariivivens TaxID=1888910 RepID=UPI0010800968|nr:hypothetical protein [Roseovarius aestuariivivens]
MSFSTKTIYLGVITSLLPIMAQADCVELDAAGSAVLCTGADPDGYVSVFPGVNVQVFGQVFSPADALALFGPGPTVTNMGSIQGTDDGIFAPTNLSLTNVGTVFAGAGAAVATTSGAEIDNFGTLTGAAGEAITSLLDLNLSNLAGKIESIAGAETISAGTNALIVNSAGGQITSNIGTAVHASFHLDLQNRATSNITSKTGTAVEAGSFAAMTNSGTIDGFLGGVSLGMSSNLTNQLLGRIKSSLGPTIEGSGRVTITNRAGATIENERIGPAILLRQADGSLVTNGGTIEANDGPVLDLGASGSLRFENEFSGEVVNRLGDGVLVRAGQFDLRNAGLIRTEGDAVRQTGGMLDMTNETNGRIISDAATAIVAEDTLITNRKTAVIEGEQTAIRLSGGTINNEGHIEARDVGRTGTAIVVERSADDVTVNNRGEIAGTTGIRFDARHAGDRRIHNAGRILAGTGPAIDFASGLGHSILLLEDESEISGNVIFGGSDDELRIFDISSRKLIDGFFDGGAGYDRLIFSGTYEAADFLSFAFFDQFTVGIDFRTERGDVLFGTFRNFELFEFGGVEKSFAELRAMNVAPVPLPAALPMLLAGLALLRLLAGRRSRQAHNAAFR